MRFSVIICTRNRAGQLCRTLRSITQCTAPPEGEWEVIVVNNGSTDDTSVVVEEFKQMLPLRTVLEPKPGLSNARNCGTRAARGTWLLWTDDDVSVGAGWLDAYDKAIHRFRSAQVLGGPIRVDFEGSPPRWLLEGKAEVRSAYAGLEPDDIVDPFQAAGRVPYGANFAVRRTLILDYPFDANLGRHPNWPLRGGEETSVIRQALTLGQGRWLRGASVVHHIDQSRQTKRYIRYYYYKYGKKQQVNFASRESRGRMVRDIVCSLLMAGRSEMRQFMLGESRSISGCTANLKDAGGHWGRAFGTIATLRQFRKGQLHGGC